MHYSRSSHKSLSPTFPLPSRPSSCPVSPRSSFRECMCRPVQTSWIDGPLHDYANGLLSYQRCPALFQHVYLQLRGERKKTREREKGKEDETVELAPCYTIVDLIKLMRTFRSRWRLASNPRYPPTLSLTLLSLSLYLPICRHVPLVDRVLKRAQEYRTRQFLREPFRRRPKDIVKPE